MRHSIYPLTLTFATSGGEIAVKIGRSNWIFATRAEHRTFEALPVAERLRLRSEFEAQVALARATPV